MANLTHQKVKCIASQFVINILKKLFTIVSVAQSIASLVPYSFKRRMKDFSSALLGKYPKLYFDHDKLTDDLERVHYATEI